METLHSSMLQYRCAFYASPSDRIVTVTGRLHHRQKVHRAPLQCRVLSESSPATSSTNSTQSLAIPTLHELLTEWREEGKQKLVSSSRAEDAENRHSVWHDGSHKDFGSDVIDAPADDEEARGLLARMVEVRGFHVSDTIGG